jgi:hypothetical protein
MRAATAAPAAALLAAASLLGLAGPGEFSCLVGVVGGRFATKTGARRENTPPLPSRPLHPAMRARCDGSGTAYWRCCLRCQRMELAAALRAGRATPLPRFLMLARARPRSKERERDGTRQPQRPILDPWGRGALIPLLSPLWAEVDPLEKAGANVGEKATQPTLKKTHSPGLSRPTSPHTKKNSRRVRLQPPADRHPAPAGRRVHSHLVPQVDGLPVHGGRDGE